MGLRLGMGLGDLSRVQAQTVCDLWDITFPPAQAGGAGGTRTATQADIDAFFGSSGRGRRT